MPAVAAFTDTYLPTVNGVSYTLATWRSYWRRRGHRMDVVYPRAAGHPPSDGEIPVRSVPFPFYEGYRLGLPVVPDTVRDVDLVHVHTPFTLGVAGLRLAGRTDLPCVASYHTPTAEYTDYIAPTDRLATALRRVSEGWERAFLGRVDKVLVPSGITRAQLVNDVGIDTPVEVLPNGVDIEHFRPVDSSTFLTNHDLADTTIVGYTGRHGYEKRLDELLQAAAGLDVTVVLGGDGPARDDLEARVQSDNVRFLGFLDREELPAFYSAMDVFAFPSPVETQGLVALEAMACGTPVVGVDQGALAETIETGVTGYHYTSGDIEGFRQGIRRALDEHDRLRENCLDRREDMSVEATLDRLGEIYRSV